jgi:hypothetical protein
LSVPSEFRTDPIAGLDDYQRALLRPGDKLLLVVPAQEETTYEFDLSHQPAESWVGLDGEPQRIIVYFGPDFEESWIESGHGWEGKDVKFTVRYPLDADPMEFLTPEQSNAIGPGDSVVICQVGHNERDSHLQFTRPPWKRSSFREEVPETA